ncbi:hypothetical protein V6Z11_A06G042900 [Gossypium hirsutum]
MLLIWAIVLFSVKHGPGICLCHGPWTCNLDENVMKYVSYTVLYYYSGTLSKIELLFFLRLIIHICVFREE